MTKKFQKNQASKIQAKNKVMDNNTLGLSEVDINEYIKLMRSLPIHTEEEEDPDLKVVFNEVDDLLSLLESVRKNKDSN